MIDGEFYCHLYSLRCNFEAEEEESGVIKSHLLFDYLRKLVIKKYMFLFPKSALMRQQPPITRASVYFVVSLDFRAI